MFNIWGRRFTCRPPSCTSFALRDLPTVPFMPSFMSNHRAGGSRAPAFQPPSFYAAAAGLHYPQASNADNSAAIDNHVSSSNMYPSIPVAGGDSDSARENGEHQARHGTPRRSGSLSRSLLPGSHRPDKEKVKHGRVESQIMDIPFLETSLLPSLRDTIDKMTHPPRTDAQDQGYMDAPSHGQSSADYGAPSSSSHRTKGATLNTNSRRDAGRSPILSPGYASAISSGSKSSGSALQGASGLRTPQVTTPKTAYSTPKLSTGLFQRESPAAVTSTVPRSALKSPYRTPQQSSPVTTSAPVSSSPAVSPHPGKSLRSVKSMVASAQSTLSQLTPSMASVSWLLLPLFTIRLTVQICG